MKDDNFNLDYDGNNIYITVKTHASLSTRIFLILCTLMLVCFMLVSIIEKMPVFTFGTICLLLLLVRYTSWVLYGKETLTINKRTISFYKTYLFIKMPVVTKQIGKKLTVISYDTHVYGKTEKVKVVLETCYYNDRPENLYEFTLPVTQDQSEMISYMVKLLYLNKITFNFKAPRYSLN